jgi:hypothetical protein
VIRLVDGMLAANAEQRPQAADVALRCQQLVAGRQPDDFGRFSARDTKRA